MGAAELKGHLEPMLCGVQRQTVQPTDPTVRVEMCKCACTFAIVCMCVYLKTWLQAPFSISLRCESGNCRDQQCGTNCHMENGSKSGDEAATGVVKMEGEGKKTWRTGK